MKTTGVVRRIDDLGRIVVPKEIRRNLRIRDGESLEILVDKDIIALKKYSPISDIKYYAQDLTNAISNVTLSNILVTDRDNVIAATGIFKKKYIDLQISTFLDELITKRDKVGILNNLRIELSNGLFEEGFFIYGTIFTNGDQAGLVLFYNANEVSEIEEKLLLIISNFLGKHIE